MTKQAEIDSFGLGRPCVRASEILVMHKRWMPTTISHTLRPVSYICTTKQGRQAKCHVDRISTRHQGDVRPTTDVTSGFQVDITLHGGFIKGRGDTSFHPSGGSPELGGETREAG